MKILDQSGQGRGIPGSAPPDFDRVARLYRGAEYLTLGPLLKRTRGHFLPLLAPCRRALLLGDGDGRFTAALLTRYPTLKAHALDSSQKMLTLLRQRTGPTPNLTTRQADLTQPFALPFAPDLIVTHFFLDCLTQPQLETLIARLHPQPETLWLLSDFRIPQGPLARPAAVFIRLLYLAFRLLTRLRVTHLPDHATALRRAGFTPIAMHRRLFGILTSELWKKT